MFEEEAEYDPWVKSILALPIAVLIAVYWLILLRKFRTLNDGLEIVLGFAYRIPFGEIEEIEKGAEKSSCFSKGSNLQLRKT